MAWAHLEVWGIAVRTVIHFLPTLKGWCSCLLFQPVLFFFSFFLEMQAFILKYCANTHYTFMLLIPQVTLTVQMSPPPQLLNYSFPWLGIFAFMMCFVYIYSFVVPLHGVIFAMQTGWSCFLLFKEGCWSALSPVLRQRRQRSGFKFPRWLEFGLCSNLNKASLPQSRGVTSATYAKAPPGGLFTQQQRKCQG